MKFAQFEEWMLWYILLKFQIREQSSFLNVLYHSALETKVACSWVGFVLNSQVLGLLLWKLTCKKNEKQYKN